RPARTRCRLRVRIEQALMQRMEVRGAPTRHAEPVDGDALALLHADIQIVVPFRVVEGGRSQDVDIAACGKQLGVLPAEGFRAADKALVTARHDYGDARLHSRGSSKALNCAVSTSTE